MKGDFKHKIKIIDAYNNNKVDEYTITDQKSFFEWFDKYVAFPLGLDLTEDATKNIHEAYDEHKRKNRR